MQTITRETLTAMRKEDQDFLLINVLGADAFEEGHIPGSVNIPVSQDNFAEEVERVAGSKTRPIVVYCASSDCDASIKAAKKLGEARFDNVMDYEVGIADWDDAGLPIESGATT